jgi:hypothetical protein
MTLSIYSVLALYGAYKLGSKTKREWVHNFCESAFVIGLIILPFDYGWQTMQWVKFGYLYVDEITLVLGVYLRNAVAYALCLLSSWKLAEKTHKLDLKKSLYFIFPTLTLLLVFLIAPDPGWTDWTYAFRWPELSSVTWLVSYLSDLPIRAMTAICVIAMWKGNWFVKK